LENPGEQHWIAAKRVLRYLRGTSKSGLTFNGFDTDSNSKRQRSIALSAYTDADWGGCPDTGRSTTGNLIYLGGNLINWYARKQKTVARSSAEAELTALASAVQETLWLRNLMKEIYYPQCKPATIWCDHPSAASEDAPTTIWCDNQPAIQHAYGRKADTKMKHVRRATHFVSENVKGANRTIDLNWISTQGQLADILTKPLGPQIFLRIKAALMK
jgi:hypothetical protein